MIDENNGPERAETENEGGFICPRCEGAGCRCENREVVTCTPRRGTAYSGEEAEDLELEL